MMNFDMSDKEEETYNIWYKEHKQECELYKKGIPRLNTFSFTPTGIGCGIEVECSCGEKINVTDVSCW